ncbi:hypothetical protein MMC24_005517 [Lignoscripta atroalba]|nr:hypothetical protein [Lignoscripta atroalba]
MPPSSRKPPTVVSSISRYAQTGSDENTSMILTFPTAPGGGSGSSSHQAHGIALTNLRVATDVDGHNTAGPAVRIQGTKGEIQVDGPAYMPTHYRIIPKGDGASSQRPNVKEVDCPIPGGHGMFWEADEAGRCVRDGKLESEGMGWEESVVIMETMDQVRSQNGLVYPERIESTEYPIKL